MANSDVACLLCFAPSPGLAAGRWQSSSDSGATRMYRQYEALVNSKRYSRSNVPPYAGPPTTLASDHAGKRRHAAEAVLMLVTDLSRLFMVREFCNRKLVSPGRDRFSWRQSWLSLP